MTFVSETLQFPVLLLCSAISKYNVCFRLFIISFFQLFVDSFVCNRWFISFYSVAINTYIV